MIHTPHDQVRIAKAKQAEHEAAAEREHLLNEVQPPTGLRRWLALLLYSWAKRLAPEIERFRSEPQKKASWR